ncbi:MAG: rhodanese-like domain-containing protein, partial [Cyanobacteria bacterium J06641_5]
RNTYEIDIGSFQGARSPETGSFREFPNYAERELDPGKHKKVALFCTGGIRCEKATAYLLAQGFSEVYHLKGGILKYLETIPEAESLWNGECFVFDERVAVGHGLDPGSHELCLGCGHPVSEAEQQSPAYARGICCPHCHDRLTPEKRDRLAARQRQRES